MGVGRLAEHTLVTLSSGERSRVLLARSLMNDPAIVLLDEPSSGLDLAGREQLVEALDHLAEDPGAPPLVVVTHHVEDVPTTLTHAMLMRSGGVVAAGGLGDVLTAERLSDTFGVELRLERRGDGRFSAWAASLSSLASAAVLRRTSSSRIRPSTFMLHSSPVYSRCIVRSAP